MARKYMVKYDGPWATREISAASFANVGVEGEKLLRLNQGEKAEVSKAAFDYLLANEEGFSEHVEESATEAK